MPFHSTGDPEFWTNCPPSLEDTRAAAVAAGWQAAVFPMGDDPEADDIPVVSLLYIPPNQTLNRHTHDCFRVEVLLEGTLDLGDRVMRPGDVGTSRPGEFYGPHVAGPTGSLSVEIFSRSGGMRSRTEAGGRVQIAPVNGPKA